MRNNHSIRIHLIRPKATSHTELKQRLMRIDCKSTPVFFVEDLTITTVDGPRREKERFYFQKKTKTNLIEGA